MKPSLPPFILAILAALAFPLVSPAQKKELPPPVRIRAVLHDPVRTVANLFYTDQTGNVVPLNFRPKDLTETLSVLPSNGSLVLYNKAIINPEIPNDGLAASVTLPAGFQRGIVVVLPAPAGGGTAYRMLLIDDSEKAFPGGESRAVSLLGIDTAIHAGEHPVPVPPGKITRVPFVKKVNEFNMAQTNFYYKQGGSWVPFAERQLQYLDVRRRLFIIHATPGAIQPTITTIVDMAPIKAPPP